jgi:hypothetical protein
LFLDHRIKKSEDRELRIWYSGWRASFDFDRVDYGVGGVELFRAEDLSKSQLSYALTPDGKSLGGTGPGEWRPEWVVIGRETACGDPIFVSQTRPYPVFTAMHGQGSWEAMAVAPSLEMFRDCLELYRRFAQGRDSSLALEENPPSRQEQTQFIRNVRQLTANDESAWMFWAVQIEIDPESCSG